MKFYERYEAPVFCRFAYLALSAVELIRNSPNGNVILPWVAAAANSDLLSPGAICPSIHVESHVTDESATCSVYDTAGDSGERSSSTDYCSDSADDFFAEAMRRSARSSIRSSTSSLSPSTKSEQPTSTPNLLHILDPARSHSAQL